MGVVGVLYTEMRKCKKEEEEQNEEKGVFSNTFGTNDDQVS